MFMVRLVCDTAVERPPNCMCSLNITTVLSSAGISALAAPLESMPVTNRSDAAAVNRRRCMTIAPNVALSSFRDISRYKNALASHSAV